MSDFVNTIDLLGDEAVMDSIIDRSITEFKDDKISVLGNRAFLDCANLTKVVLPLVTKIGGYTYYFSGCSGGLILDLPKLESIGYEDLDCANMRALIIRRTDKVCTASHTNSLGNVNKKSGMYASTCNLYVPSAMVESYKTATNWAGVTDKIRALEDYTVDGTTTGELDESKI